MSGPTTKKWFGPRVRSLVRQNLQPIFGKVFLAGVPGNLVVPEVKPLKEKLYLAVLTALIGYAVPRMINLLSQLTLALIQHLFQKPSSTTSGPRRH